MDQGITLEFPSRYILFLFRSPNVWQELEKNIRTHWYKKRFTN